MKLILDCTESGVRKSKACESIGLSIRTIQRWEKLEDLSDKRRGPNTISNKLSDQEQETVLEELLSKQHVDYPPGIVVAKLADKGKYLCSESTMYRILKANSLTGNQRRCRDYGSSPAKIITDKAEAFAPNEIWSWDISWLKTYVAREYYYLYLIMDIFSRYIVGYTVHDRECTIVASDLISSAMRKEIELGNKIHLHSDNGSPMRSQTTVKSERSNDLVLTFSRPRVKNDNPFSESLFKTLKYCPFYPYLKRFKNIDSAKVWISNFVKWYNHEHFHSGINYVTPHSRHFGLDKEILINRQKVFENARSTTPERWTGSTRDWSPSPSSKLKHVRYAIKREHKQGIA